MPTLIAFHEVEVGKLWARAWKHCTPGNRHMVRPKSGMVALLVLLGCTAAPCRATPEAELRAAVAAVEQALQATDPTAWVYHYTEDACFVGPGAAPVQGRKALLEMARSMPPLRNVKPTIQRLEVNDELGFTLVRGSWIDGDAPGDQPTTRVRSLIVWRRQPDGQWRITQELMHEDPGSR